MISTRYSGNTGQSGKSGGKADLKRRGNTTDTRGTAFVVFEDIFDAKTAVEKLHGFQVAKRHLIVLYYQPHKLQEQQNQALEQRKKEMAGHLYRK